MKKSIIFLIGISLCISLTGCGNGNPSGENEIPQLSNSDQEISDGKTGAGGIVPDFSIDERYESISSSLIGYVGQEAFEEWLNQEENITILNFIEYFQIPKDTFTQLVRLDLTPEFCQSFAPDLTLSEIQDMLGYSYSEIDALYSGDQEQVNRAFCGPLAFVNDADGEIYSIYWLAEHTAQDYIDAGLPMDQIEAVIQKAASEEFRLYDLAETAQSKFVTALSLEAAESSPESETVSSESEPVSPEPETTSSEPETAPSESDVTSAEQ